MNIAYPYLYPSLYRTNPYIGIFCHSFSPKLTSSKSTQTDWSEPALICISNSVPPGGLERSAVPLRASSAEVHTQTDTVAPILSSSRSSSESSLDTQDWYKVQKKPV